MNNYIYLFPNGAKKNLESEVTNDSLRFFWKKAGYSRVPNIVDSNKSEGKLIKQLEIY